MYNRDKIKKELDERGLDSNSFDYLYKYLYDNNLMDKISDYTDRLLNGEAVQYIIGNACFYGYDFKVNKNTLIPRFETELLVEKTINYINKYFDSNVSVLDIGTGSGCIAITLNKEINSRVTAVDISKEALDVAKINSINNDADVNFIISDVFSNINDKYDVIISNPPYIGFDEKIMDVVYNNEPHLALYASMNGLFFYDKILSECVKYLNDNYLIAFEIGYQQGEDVVSLAKKYLSGASITVDRDYSGKDRFVFITNMKR